ncbi:MAG: rplV [Chlamydiia bacterium]|nr:rplV [Chlamydiia bacterium]
MSYQAITKYVRISPRKARLAADLIRGLPIAEARLQLSASSLKGGRLLIKTLDSAVANAEMQSETSAEKLKVEEVRVDEGPRLKRSKPRSRGSRHPFLKRMSHFTVIVGEA